MKSLLLFILSLVCLSTYSQDSIESECYASDNVVSKNIHLPIIRKINGGTKIIPEFVGNWTYEMEGAFEYACKIWEEALPTTFPIRIRAILDESRQTNALSKVTFMTKSHTNDPVGDAYTNVSTWTQIKGTAFDEMSGVSDTHIYDSIIAENMFTEPDITITYYNRNNRLVDNCSFSLLSPPNENYYDFVTLALRDIAKSLGLVWNNQIVRNEEFRINLANIIPFEKFILEALNYSGNNHQAYLNALQGSLDITGENKYVLYAPSTWDQDRSLNYFIPNSAKKITQLLSYDFGRGSIIRDISDQYNDDLFRDILQWKGDIATGTGSGGGISNVNTETNDLIPYQGNISITNTDLNVYNVLEPYNTTTNSNIIDLQNTDNSYLLDSLIQFHPNYRTDGSTRREGWTVSILLKDGSWDIVYTANISGCPDLEISTDYLTFHHDLEEYARTCDGYLRCRITYAYTVYPGARFAGKTYYYVMDHLPQNVKMRKSRVLATNNEEDYYRDVEIGLKDIEGVTRIFVSQLDAWNDVPYMYEIADFKDGKFTATVDREYSTTFTITAYNANGTTVSYPYVLPPLTPVANLNLNFTLEEDVIRISSDSRRRTNEILISAYNILPISTNNIANINTNNLSNSYNTIESNNINICNLSKGMYILNITDIKGDEHSFKFLKQ